MTVDKKDKRPYRKGVGAVLFNADGLVFAARRLDTAQKAWQLPQGGIDGDEDPKEALFRELEEEIGTAKAEIIAEIPDLLSYDLPAGLSSKVWKGRFRGQQHKWYALRFLGNDEDIDITAYKNPEFSDWKWVVLESLPGMIVPFKRPVYEAVVDAFRHLPDSLRSKNR
ncbi:MAG TPA: RNA pyrophosphohydrolase [Alphaproteobacteria bacterium]|nr:RNA pyrophosphohydrolase [Alphaproteobacteria bacterium]